MQQEIRAITTAAGHPNVVKLIEIIDDNEKDKLLIVMENVERGRILEWQADFQCFKAAAWAPQNDQGFLDEDIIRSCVRDVASGLKFLHEKGILHRDIKPQNILFTNDYQAKIVDFGVSTILESPDASD